VNFPSATLPSPGALTFAETFDVNYTSSLVNESISIQRWDGAAWQDLESFVGNSAQFTEAYYGVNTAWANFGTNTVRAASGACASSPSTIDVVADQNAPLLDFGVYTVIALVILLLYLAGRRLGWVRFAVVAGAVYLALSPFTGQRYDVFFLLSSGIRVLQHVNPFSQGSPPLYPGALKWADPPLYAFYSAFSFNVFQLLTGAPLPSVAALTWPGWMTAIYNSFEAYVPGNLPALVFLLKLPMVAAAVVTGFLLKKMAGREALAVAWLANPLVILVAAIWGTIDPIATLLALGSVYAFQKGKEYHAYLLASFGAAVKFWPALLIPLMLVVSLRKQGRSAAKPLVAVLPAVGVTLALYGISGGLVENLSVLLYARGIPTFGGIFSVNGLTWQHILVAVNAPPIPFFLYVGVPAYAVILGWVYWKREGDIVKWTTISILVFFLTYNYVNPQYFYWILPFLMLKERRLATGVFTALPLIAMFFTYNIFYFVSPALLPELFSLGASVLDQMKVGFSNQTTALSLLVSAVIPTVAYVALLFRELVMRGKPRQVVRDTEANEGSAASGQ
jgi:hypothetical protein